MQNEKELKASIETQRVDEIARLKELEAQKASRKEQELAERAAELKRQEQDLLRIISTS